MSFDDQISKVASHLAELRASGQLVREFALPASVEALQQDLPIRIGPGANPKIILRSETFLELGNPAAGSCALVLWTDNPSLITDGRMTLIGPDIHEAPGASLPFGQILLVAGHGLSPAEHQAVAQTQYVADQIEGYMVKSSSRNIWSRVSQRVAAKGFCFETLGRSLMAIYKASVPKVHAMEVIFVTSSREDVLRLHGLAQEVREIGTEIVKEHWKAKGYDLDCDLDCRSCHDKEVCDDIRKVAAARLRKEKKGASASPPRQSDDEGDATSSSGATNV
jgi:CO dehydrogenase/acetyl-CoA synthase beta subunit